MPGNRVRPVRGDHAEKSQLRHLAAWSTPRKRANVNLGAHNDALTST